MPLWQSKGWRNNKGKKVGDQDLVMQLYHGLILLKPELHWVRGHSGIMENEVADHLAKQGADLDPKVSPRKNGASCSYGQNLPSSRVI